MGKIIFFIFGLIGGIALASILYLQASTKYNTAQNGGENAVSNLTEAQTLWPPYRLDSRFQKDFKKLQGKRVSGPNIIVYLKEDVSSEDTESLVNQLEVMDGVEKVHFNTLERPLEYINNMTRLPDSKDDIRDNIVVTTDNNSDKIIEFIKLQEIVEKVSTSN